MKKLRSVLIAFLVLTTLIVTGQTAEPFSYLDEIEVESFGGAFLHLIAEQATIINKRRADLNEDHIFYAEECDGESMALVAICKLQNSSSREYAIVYNTCASPSFMIFDSTNPDKLIGEINSSHLYINGSGNIYGSGGEGTFDARKKYSLKNGNLEQIQQPFYYVGLKSKTLNPVTIYQSKNLQKKIANLPTNYDIEVLLSEKVFNSTEALYLVKTSFGLVGWANLKAGQYKSIDVEGLIYYGD